MKNARQPGGIGVRTGGVEHFPPASALITALELKNFRGFGELTIAPFKRVNLLSGKNNTGKTGVLEALYLALSDQNELVDQVHRVFRQGAKNADQYWSWIFDRRSKLADVEILVEANDLSIGRRFSRKKSEKQIERKGKLHWDLKNMIQDVYVLESDTHHQALLECAAITTVPRFPQQEAADFTLLTRKKRRDQAIGLLRKIDARVQGIEIAVDSKGAPSIDVNLEGIPEMVPLNFLGQGFARLLSIYSIILAENANVILIDEIENGIHHSAMRTVWDGLALAARELDVQIFATTHSRECILAAHEAFEASESYDLSLLRLERHGEEVRAVAVDEGGIQIAEEFGLEVR